MTEYHALLSDGLISEDTLSICKTAIDAHKTRRFNATSRVLFAFGQPFYIRFGRFSKFYVIDTSGYQERIIDVLWVYPFNENGPLYRSGSAICCFELSNLPEHEGTRSVVIRVLKILEPITQTPQDDPRIHLPEVVEGGLLKGWLNKVTRYKIRKDEKLTGDQRRGLRYLKEYPEAIVSALS
ncbi:hypothetical protein PHLCEN_2v7907 [Hermanssonia centrifuga]|uniref:Uncharacterized protein n=2 Tax=Hermanssonia centrifuga TaxID=98765 RepID=A0A2R6NVD2_9APHY|nr:hypothetical protein PHLCEN_2v7907 [Hermanssonia centrifuga]